MSFVVNKRNDSISVDCHSMLKKWKVKNVINNLTVDVPVGFCTFSRL